MEFDKRFIGQGKVGGSARPGAGVGSIRHSAPLLSLIHVMEEQFAQTIIYYPRTEKTMGF